MIIETEVDRLQVKVYADRPAMGQAVAGMVAAKIDQLLSRKDRVNMIFAAAPSQNEFLECLARETQVDWTRVHAYHMDEYVGLNQVDKTSFGYFLKTSLFDKLPFGGIHYLNGKAEAVFLEAQRYSGLLKVHAPDIVCLGIGENTHIAFNDPHTADFNDIHRVKVVDLDLASRMQQVHDGCFPDLDSVPTHALTLTIPCLLSAESLFCIVPGKSKAEAVRATLNEDISERYPATILRRHPGCVLFLDEQSAASLLQPLA